MNLLNIFRPKRKKYLEPQSYNQLYNQLNQELYRYIYLGSPHIMDDNDENYITQGYTYNSLIYSIVNYMATTAASVNWKLEQRKGDDVEEIYDHEFLDLWNNPNPQQSNSEMVEEMLLYKYVTGNTYVYGPKVKNGANAGKAVKLEIMPAHEITPIFGDVVDPVKGYIFRGAQYDREIDVEDVVHIKYANIDTFNQSPIVGLSPLKSLVLVTTQNNDAWKYLASSFQNGLPAGFISKDGGPDNEFTPEQAKSLIERLEKEHSGPHNANRMAAIGGNARWNQIGLSPVDLKILESISVSYIQICNVYKFPAVLLNYDKVSTYNNWQEAQRVLWTNALMHDLDIIGEKITNKYLKDGVYGEGLTLKPDYSTVEALQKNRAELVQWLTQAWWIKGSRKQEIMGEDVDPELDQYYIPAGLIPTGSIPEFEEVEKQLHKLGVNGY